MTTTGMTLFDMDWLNRSADGAICVRCGFVHTFMAQAHQWVDPAEVKPEAQPPADGAQPAAERATQVVLTLRRSPSASRSSTCCAL